MRQAAAWLVVLGLQALGWPLAATVAMVLLPGLLAPRGDDLGLRPRPFLPHLEVFAILSLLTLPEWVLLTRPVPDWGRAAIGLVTVAFPEELFFRGFLQKGWAAAGGRKVRLLGVSLGWEWPAASAAFAATHLWTQGPRGLLVFFPGLLFGWAFGRTGAIWGAVLFHAACNALA